MRTLFLFIVVIAFALPVAAQVPPPPVEWGTTPGGVPGAPPGGPYGGEVIEVPPGDVETIWFHIMAGPESLWHLNDFGVEFQIHPSGPIPPSYGEVIAEYAQTSIEYHGCSWIPLVSIKVDGPPCTFFHITASIDLGATGGQHQVTIVKHIIPEPATMGLLAAGLVGVVLRRRRR